MGYFDIQGEYVMMDISDTNNNNYTSGAYEDNLVVEQENLYGSYYMYETGKSFVDICKDIGVDSNNIPFSLM